MFTHPKLKVYAKALVFAASAEELSVSYREVDKTVTSALLISYEGTPELARFDKVCDKVCDHGFKLNAVCSVKMSKVQAPVALRLVIGTCVSQRETCHLTRKVQNPNPLPIGWNSGLSMHLAPRRRWGGC
jgi:hypothetical protein